MRYERNDVGNWACIRLYNETGRLVFLFALTPDQADAMEDEIARAANRRNKKAAAERRKERTKKRARMHTLIGRGVSYEAARKEVYGE